MGSPDQNQGNDPQKDRGKKAESKFGEEGLVDFVKSNTKDSIAYLLLIVGLVFLFFEPFFGGILIGLVTGLYFSKEIIFLFQNGNNFVEEQGMVRAIVLGITALALFIQAPGIFIGGALSIALKHLFKNEDIPRGTKPPENRVD